MAATVGQVLINIAADTQELRKGMDKATKSVKKTTDFIKKAFIPVLAIFAGGSLIGKINETSAAIDKLGKTSSRLGIGVEALQELRFAADLSGVSINTLDMALQRSTRRIAEAAQGTGEAVKALEELGLSAQTMASLTPDEQMYELADALSEVTNQGDKVRLSMKLFDSEGVALLNMLDGGSKGLRGMAREANKLGIVMSQDNVRAVEASNDAWGTLGKVMDTIAQGMSVGLAKSFTDVIGKLSETGSRFNLFDNAVKGTAYAVFTTLDVIAVGVNAVESSLAGFNSALAYLNLLSAQMFTDQDKIAKAQNQVIIANNAAVDSTDALWVSLDKLLNGNKAIVDSLMYEISVTKKVIDGKKELINVNDLLAKYKYTPTDDESYAIMLEDIKSLNTAVEQGVITNTQYQDTLRGIGEAWSNVGKDGEASLSSLEENVQTLTNSISGQLESAMSSTIRSWMDDAADWGDMMSSLLKDIAAELIRVLVIKQAIGAITTAVTGSSSTSTTPIGQTNYDGTFASGGVVNSPTAFSYDNGKSGLMGEAGAEAIMPLTRIGGDLGVKAVVPTVNIINNASSEVEVSQSKASGDNIDIMIEKKVKSMFGTGSMDKTLNTNYGLKRNGF